MQLVYLSVLHILPSVETGKFKHTAINWHKFLPEEPKSHEQSFCDKYISELFCLLLFLFVYFIFIFLFIYFLFVLGRRKRILSLHGLPFFKVKLYL